MELLGFHDFHIQINVVFDWSVYHIVEISIICSKTEQ